MITGNEYAFPSKLSVMDTCYGMTLRQYYAGQALPGMIKILNEDGEHCGPAEIAKAAVVMADALIAELNKESK